MSGTDEHDAASPSNDSELRELGRGIGACRERVTVQRTLAPAVGGQLPARGAEPRPQLRSLRHQQGLHALLVKRREHLVESGGSQAAGAQRLLDPGDELQLLVTLDALDHGSHGLGDLLSGGVLEVDADRPGEHLFQLAVQVAFDHRAQLVRADDDKVRKWPAQMGAQQAVGNPAHVNRRPLLIPRRKRA